MEKKIRFYVIGGQYSHYNHGGSSSLLGAKRLAAKCEEVWDSWQGWHRPSIYAAEDCVEVVTPFYGSQMVPIVGACPVAWFDHAHGRWCDWSDLAAIKRRAWQ